jgi:hypothetical protein
MSDIFQRFKQVFISPKNTEYILKLTSTKFPNIDFSTFDQHFHTTLVDLQNLIYDTYFTQICNDLKSKGRLNLEESLVALNKLSIEKLEFIASKTHSQSPPPPHEQLEIHSQPQLQIQPQLERQPQIHSQPQLQRHPQVPPQPHLQIQPQVQVEIQPQIQVSQDTDLLPLAHYHHFFSKDAILSSGKYTFHFDIENINSISLSSIRLDCNLYNITEINNKFSVYENGSDHFVVIIPFGYYTIDVLLQTISDIMNQESLNKYKYTIIRNTTKNKIYVECNSSDSMPCTFNLKFEDTSKFSSYSLQEILGFDKNEYNNNNLYVSENHPIQNVFDQFFLKLFINDKEISRYTSSNQNFSYFHSFHIDMDSYFGKSFYLQNSTNDSFDILEDVSVSEISIELWNSQNHILSRFVKFELVLFFEYL